MSTTTVPAPSTTSVTSTLTLTGSAGRVLLGFYGAGTTLLALLNLHGLVSPLPGILALVLMWAALVVLTLPGAETFGLRPTLVVVGLVEGMTLLSAWNIAGVDDATYATWHLGAATVILLVLALRGRRAIAWYAFAGLSAITIVAAITGGGDVAWGINELARQAGTLLIGTLFALVLRRAARSMSAIRDAQVIRAGRDAATSAAARERANQNARLEREAMPALERLRSPHPLTHTEVRELRLLEQSLRDGILAAGFSGLAIEAETRAARDRGIAVELLDERGAALDEADAAQLEARLLEELRGAREGSITARLSPLGRGEVATIFAAANGDYRTVVIVSAAVASRSQSRGPASRKL